MPRIELRGVSKSVAGPRPALAAVDLAVADRELLAVLGPSGSGKTTLLRLIAGLDAPTSGLVAIDGRDATGLPARRRDVAMVFQNQAPFPHLTVRGNLAFGARAQRVPTAQVADRVAEAADRLGIAGLLDRAPAALSGGERQRVALGRAIVRRPAILLLDEPFSNLDAPLRLALRTIVAGVHRDLGLTTVFVTHDQREAIAVGDRVAVLDRGRLAQVGGADDLLDRPADLFVAGFLGDPPMGTLPAEVARDGGRWAVRIGGAEVRGLDDDGAADLDRRIGPGRYRLGLRTDALRLDPVARPSVTLRLRAIENRGKERLGRFGEDGGWWAALPPASGLREGDLAPLGLDLRAASWFDADTSRRLDFEDPGTGGTLR